MVAHPRFATSANEVAASAVTFDDTLSEGADINWALAADYWVFDAVHRTFAPAKFAAFADMTASWYRELLSGPEKVSAFDGNRTQRHLAKLFDDDWEPSPALLQRLKTYLEAALGRPWEYKNLKAVRFIVIPHGSRVWWVNQGKTVDVALDAGYLWAPQKRKEKESGERTQPPYYYWSNVARVKAGDVVFNYARSLIAVSVAKGDGFEAPETDSATDEWTGDGWRVDLDTYRFQEPVPLSEFGAALTAQSTPRGPMQPNGDVKLGYLFQLSPDEAAVLAAALPWSSIPTRLRAQLIKHGLSASRERLGVTAAPHNQILFGPPGTGKTYRSAEIAVAICDGRVPATRAEVMDRYTSLRLAGRIAFVTFHQSYGYEDFVEGIRPVLTDGDEPRTGVVHYECRDGVFKRLCEAASVSRSVRGSTVVDPAKVRVWKMSLGNTQEPDNTTYEEAMEAGQLLLGWGAGLNFSGCDDRDAVREKLQADSDDYGVTAVHAFKNKMRVGDIVVVSDGLQKFRAIGRVSGDYAPPLAGESDQRRPVEWLVTFSPSLPREQILDVGFSMATIYELKKSVLKLDEINALLTADTPGEEPQNHVMIIDEINRGNVSKILGELITLLESDKRIGAPNEIRVTLPHSGEHFGVPSNVYLIGTMNTADRSIAFLDTALRRRFEFRELLPDVEFLANSIGVIEGVDVATLLKTLNSRIELMFDRDHTIGHAFFVEVKSLVGLRDVFMRKVIPLLQEYFYGDWLRLCRVLGCSYNPDTGKPASKNSHPVIVTSVLNGNLVEDADHDEIRVTCGVNPAFSHAAADEELVQFFQNMYVPPSST